MSLAGIRDGLKTRLETAISGLKCYDTAPGNVSELPCAIVFADSGTYTEDFGGAPEHTLIITLLVTEAGGFEKGQDAVDPYIAISGSKSVFAAVQADSTLGGNCDTSVVQGYRNYGVREYGDRQFFGVDFDLRAWE